MTPEERAREADRIAREIVYSGNWRLNPGGPAGWRDLAAEITTALLSFGREEERRGAEAMLAVAKRASLAHDNAMIGKWHSGISGTAIIDEIQDAIRALPVSLVEGE